MALRWRKRATAKDCADEGKKREKNADKRWKIIAGRMLANNGVHREKQNTGKLPQIGF